MIERLLDLYALLFARPIFRNLNYLLIKLGYAVSGFSITGHLI